MPEKDAPPPPFLATLKDTAAMIERLREELLDVQRQQAALEVRANDLNTRIGAFNTLRQAHGEQPV